ncbi:unnamed protein product [marine sediment metagenome]|uniref:Uncharacterized protein n=1 Tax=marine sediment metagenome TaxID=412755 RepID=X1V468_9ZZZZ
MSLATTAGKLIEGAIGLYLFLPGAEDVATGGTTLIPSAAVGAALLLHAFGVDFGKVFK